MPHYLYEHRRYIWDNAWNDLRYRYAGTGMGAFWNIVNPLIQIIIYTAVFSQLIELRSGGARGSSYVLFLCTGLFPWLSFSETIIRGSNAFFENAVYLRRLAIPLEVFVAGNLLTSTFGFVIYLLLLVPVNLLLGNRLGWSLLLLPVLALLLQGLAYGMTLALASLRVLFPDVKEILRALIHLWRWTMPIIYADTIFPENIRPLFRLNPPYVFIQSIRNVFLEQKTPSLDAWVVMIAWLLLFLLVGSLVTQKLQAEVKDVI